MSTSAGAIIEIMSSRKLTYLVCGLLAVQSVCFLLGGVVSPPPNTSTQVLGTKCVDRDADIHGDRWFYSHGEGRCDSIPDLESAPHDLTAENIVFAFQMPRPGTALEYSRWQQNLIGIMTLDIEYEPEQEHEQFVELFMKARLGYRNRGDAPGDWKPVDDSFVYRNMECGIDQDKRLKGYFYNCSLLDMFELGSLHHDYYLLNVRIPSIFMEGGIPVGINEKLGKLVDTNLIAIVQNGGFTKVLVGLKTVFFPAVFLEMVWYWRRVRMLPRESTLLERMLFALGCALTILNVPMEYFTLSFDMPWLPLFNDVKQGVFQATLVIFLLVFTGEHCFNETGETGEKAGLRAYSKKLAVALFACTCLFAFDVCERGMKLRNPFFSIWSTDLGTKLAHCFIIMGGLAAGGFFICLCYMVYRVFMDIRAKEASLSNMHRVRRAHYEGIIWRFNFLLIATVITVAMTTVGFILGQFSEGRYKWDENISIELSAAFHTGVYGLWNVYIIGLLFLYAPSHKNWNTGASDGDADGNLGPAALNGEEVEFSVQGAGPSSSASELSSLTNLMRHQAQD